MSAKAAAADTGVTVSPEPPVDPDRRRCLFAAAGLGLAWQAPAQGAVSARPALMLATDAPSVPDPRGWLVSEKLDGVRACWDGQVLRLRSGLPVAAPAWFTAGWPGTPLDGELWAGRGRFETLVGTVRRLQPDEGAWRAVRYALFDLPGADGSFAERARRLQALAVQVKQAHLGAVEQHRLDDPAALQRLLDKVVAAGGEGLMLHREAAPWRAGRSADLLKLKPLADAEAVVTGHEPGQGRHAGRLGALRVRMPDGRQFRLGTGFSDADRAAPPPPGSVVTYRYRGFTDAGLPRFASFLRVRTLP